MQPYTLDVDPPLLEGLPDTPSIRSWLWLLLWLHSLMQTSIISLITLYYNHSPGPTPPEADNTLSSEMFAKPTGALPTHYMLIQCS